MWRRLQAHQFKRTTVAFVLCVAILSGIGLARGGVLIDSSWWLVAALGVLFTAKGRRIWLMLAIVMLGLSFGLARGTDYMLKLHRFEALSGQKITLVGRATGDSVYDQAKQLTFDIRNPYVKETGEHLTGKVAVSGFGVNAVYAGDELHISGHLRLARGSYQARMSFAQIELVAHHPSLVQTLRRDFAAGLQTALPEPEASFGLGLLIGQRNTLPDDTTQILLMVGLTHIIAVSGYNLTILLRASRSLLGKRSKRQAVLLSLALIAVFLLFTGSSPSIVRAAIVSTLSIVAAYYGRNFKPVVLILLAAAITGFAYPYYVWSDVGWYLSFLAFFGVMVIAPMITERLPAKLQQSIIATVAIESLCAEVMATPFIVHIFGQMSLVGLVANVLVVALIPLAMLLSLVAGLAGMLLPAFAGWFAWPAQVLLTYMLDVAGLLSRIPHVFTQNLVFSMRELLTFYVAVMFVIWTAYRKRRSKYAIVTDRNGTNLQGDVSVRT
jgi:competence protein ComEC